jgi:hypothetical protein
MSSLNTMQILELMQLRLAYLKTLRPMDILSEERAERAKLQRLVDREDPTGLFDHYVNNYRQREVHIGNFIPTWKQAA